MVPEGVTIVMRKGGLDANESSVLWVAWPATASSMALSSSSAARLGVLETGEEGAPAVVEEKEAEAPSEGDEEEEEAPAEEEG